MIVVDVTWNGGRSRRRSPTVYLSERQSRTAETVARRARPPAAVVRPRPTDSAAIADREPAKVPRPSREHRHHQCNRAPWWFRTKLPCLAGCCWLEWWWHTARSKESKRVVQSRANVQRYSIYGSPYVISSYHVLRTVRHNSYMLCTTTYIQYRSVTL